MLALKLAAKALVLAVIVVAAPPRLALDAARVFCPAQTRAVRRVAAVVGETLMILSLFDAAAAGDSYSRAALLGAANAKSPLMVCCRAQ